VLLDWPAGQDFGHGLPASAFPFADAVVANAALVAARIASTVRTRCSPASRKVRPKTQKTKMLAHRRMAGLRKANSSLMEDRYDRRADSWLEQTQNLDHSGVA
jgi:hypothetical protein